MIDFSPPKRIKIGKDNNEDAFIYVDIDPKLQALVEKEGNFAEWIDPYSFYLCRMQRPKYFGSWCGYVRIDKDHSEFQKDMDDIDVKVHCGLTYSDHMFPILETKEIEYSKDHYWLGFDCGHSCDMIPYLWKEGVYRTREYVAKEVTRLAAQLKQLDMKAKGIEIPQEEKLELLEKNGDQS